MSLQSITCEFLGADISLCPHSESVNKRNADHKTLILTVLVLFYWRRGIVVRNLVSSNELSLSGARLQAGWVTTLQGRKPGTKCGGRPVQGVWGQKSPSGVQGRSPGRGFYMHNLDLILNYFCFARATSGWLMLRNGSCLSMK